jgi:hypothetical protein
MKYELKKIVGVSFDAETYAKLKKLAQLNCRSVSAQVRLFVAQSMEARKMTIIHEIDAEELAGRAEG